MRQTQAHFSNAYQWQKSLYTRVVSAFVTDFIKDLEHLNPSFTKTVNASVLGKIKNAYIFCANHIGVQ